MRQLRKLRTVGQASIHAADAFGAVGKIELMHSINADEQHVADVALLAAALMLTSVQVRG